MEYKLGDVSISTRFPETLTQNYHAGALIATLHSQWPEIEIPTVLQCMVNYHSLRELLGDRVWSKLRTSYKTKSRIQIYEKLSYQPSFPPYIMGTSRDFMLGYVRVYGQCKVKHKNDAQIVACADFIQNLLEGNT